MPAPRTEVSRGVAKPPAPPRLPDTEFFERIATGTAEELARALDCYYPVEGNNDIAEEMTATYLAFQFRDYGFRVFPQVQCSNRISNHLDFAAINPDTATVVLTEAKRINKSEGARSLGQDWRRLQAASITSDLRHIPTDYRRFACLVATTWRDDYRDWWLASDRPATPGRSRNPEDWADLRDALGRAVANAGRNVPLDRLDWKDQLSLLISFIPLTATALVTGA